MGKIQKFCILWVMLFLAAAAISSRGQSQQNLQPQPITGSFEYRGELTPVMKIQVEKVVALSDEGKSRLATLKNQDYGCHHVMRGIWRCARQSSLSQVEEWVNDRVEKQITTQVLHFPESSGAVIEEGGSDSFKLWRVQRPVHTDGGVYESYEWTWTPTIQKIILRDRLDELPTLYFNLDERLGVSQQYSVSHTLDKNRFEIHLIQAHFSKVK